MSEVSYVRMGISCLPGVASFASLYNSYAIEEEFNALPCFASDRDSTDDAQLRKDYVQVNEKKRLYSKMGMIGNIALLPIGQIFLKTYPAACAAMTLSSCALSILHCMDLINCDLLSRALQDPKPVIPDLFTTSTIIDLFFRSKESKNPQKLFIGVGS